jgi:hypothetical protein
MYIIAQMAAQSTVMAREAWVKAVSEGPRWGTGRILAMAGSGRDLDPVPGRPLETVASLMRGTSSKYFDELCPASPYIHTYVHVASSGFGFRQHGLLPAGVFSEGVATQGGGGGRGGDAPSLSSPSMAGSGLSGPAAGPGNGPGNGPTDAVSAAGAAGSATSAHGSGRSTPTPLLHITIHTHLKKNEHTYIHTYNHP